MSLICKTPSSFGFVSKPVPVLEVEVDGLSTSLKYTTREMLWGLGSMETCLEIMPRMLTET